MANKYVRILSKLMARLLARALPSHMAEAAFAALSGRLGVRTITADGAIGRFQGLPGDMVLRGYMETGDYSPGLRRLISRCLGDGGDLLIDGEGGDGTGVTLLRKPYKKDQLAEVVWGALDQ